jgi:hypothetical protein
MSPRKLACVVIVVAALRTQGARADVGFGLFLGEPTGVDLKIGLGPRSGLDILAGFHEYYRDHYGGDYGHLTYLVTPVVGHGSSVLVPFRLGIGVALLDSGASFGDNLHVGVRAPLEIGFRFRSVPLEVYGEISALLVFQHDPYLDVDGGLGLRFYF